MKRLRRSVLALGVAAAALAVGVGCAPRAFTSGGPSLPGGMKISLFGGPQLSSPMVEQDAAARPEQSGTSDLPLTFAAPMATDSQAMAREQMQAQTPARTHLCPYSTQ